MAKIVRITIPPPGNLDASNPAGGTWPWKIYDGDLCEIVNLDQYRSIYTLSHPKHPNEPFNCSSHWVREIADNSPAPAPAPGRSKPASCTCSINQLWKTGCMCGHIDRYTLKMRI